MYSPDYNDNPSGAYSLKNRRISPRDEISGNMHVSTTRLCSLGSKNNKKNFCKSWRNKRSITQRSSKKLEGLSKLVRQFLANRFSAAGVRYIVRSRSKWRKILWFIVIVLTVVFMGYMTFNVIKEYLNFPKMLIREDRITPKLQFPAVTLCSLNPIFNLTSNDTSVYKFIRLKGLFDRAEVIPSNEYLRDECYFHPLCQWSWFEETCNCVKNPCQTEFCLPVNDTHCGCSLNICRDFDKFTSCYVSNNSERCICSVDAEYMDYQELEEYNRKKHFDEDSDDIPKPVRDLMELIRNSTTYDLVDLEESLLPTVNDLLEYGIKYDNLVISCSFDSALCFRENFTVLYHQLYGRCYMFNYLGDVPTTENPVFAYNYGSSSGLRLMLHVLKQDKIDLLNSEIGVRIVIHDPYSIPFVAEYGINVRPHDMSAIEVKQTVVKRLKPPYGACVDDGSHLKFNLSAGQPYSILGCQKACRHHYLMRACNCTKRNYILGSVFYTKTKQITFCKVVNKTQYDCMVNIISKIELGSILCDCRPPCTETIYSTTVSSSDLNENYYKAVKNVRTFYTDDDGKPKTINATDERNLMVGIKVYYSTFQVNTDNEQASYSWETLIANIGGNLGFFMGLTLVTFMEVLEFLWDIFFTTIRGYREPRARLDRPLRMFAN